MLLRLRDAIEIRLAGLIGAGEDERGENVETELGREASRAKLFWLLLLLLILILLLLLLLFKKLSTSEPIPAESLT